MHYGVDSTRIHTILACILNQITLNAKQGGLRGILPAGTQFGRNSQLFDYLYFELNRIFIRFALFR